MKLREAAKLLKDGWVRKRVGFRVQFERRETDRWVEDCFPDQEEKPIRSEIAAWEYARRFAETTQSRGREIEDGDVVNIRVIDDLGEPVRFYGTNQMMVLNPLEHERTRDEEKESPESPDAE